MVWQPPEERPAAPKLDAYSLRLVSSRALYDLATSVTTSPHLAGLARPQALRVNPAELERLGVEPGGVVRVTSPRTTLTLPTAADPDLPRGSAALVFNLATPGAADLIDATADVTEVRVETT
jgi:anaerobic selenocysteine-containing dehydrogenase